MKSSSFSPKGVGLQLGVLMVERTGLIGSEGHLLLCELNVSHSVKTHTELYNKNTSDSFILYH